MQDHVVHRSLQVADVDPEPGAGVALRVEVDDEHPVAEVGQAGAEVHGRGRLAHAALLVGDREDAGERAGERRRLVGRHRPRRRARPRRRHEDRLAGGVASDVRQIRCAGEGTGRRRCVRGRALGGRRGPKGLQLVVRQGGIVGRFRLLRGALAAVARVASSEPLEDRPPPGGQIIRRVAHRRILPAGRPGRKDPAPCSTWNPRPLVRRCSTWNTVRRAAAWPGARRGGGRSRDTSATLAQRLDRGRRGRTRRRSPGRGAPARPPASGRDRAPGARSRRAARRRANSGAAHSAVTAGEPKLRATTAAAVPRSGPCADHLRPTLDHGRTERQGLDGLLEEPAALARWHRGARPRDRAGRRR